MAGWGWVLLIWLAVSVPAGILIGKYIKKAGGDEDDS